MSGSPGSVVTLLCSGMHFFNAEKRIADCVLNNTAEAAAMTSAELAHCSSTSEATVTRFCKKLGFDNYRAFQLALARDVMERQPLEVSMRCSWTISRSRCRTSFPIRSTS